jgi:6-phosphogluconolactonase (cycloisomerase 2 family)
MKAAGGKNWASAASATLVTMLLGLGIAGCGYGNNFANTLGCGFAGNAVPGPTPAAGSEFVFVPNALCAPGVANNVMSVLVLNGTTFNNGPVALVQTGNEPVWATVDPTNHFVYVTNFADNTVSAFTLDTGTGKIGVVPGSPFPSGIGPAAAAVDPSGTFLYVANDGSSSIAGSISGYKINANGSLTAVSGSPFTTNPALTPQQGIAVTAGFVYVSNIATNNVSVFSFDNTGKLTQLATSPFTLAPALNPQPESLAVDPAGNLLFTANMTSNNVSAFTVNGDGSLTQNAGSPFSTGFSSPQYLTTDQTGTFLYVVNVGNNTVTAYTTTGAQRGTALATGNFPEGLAVDAANKVVMVANCQDGDLSVYDINGDGSLTGLGALTSNNITACPQMVATTH